MAIARTLFDQARIKSNLVDAVENVGSSAGNFFPDYGVDLDNDNVPGLAIIHQGKKGRIAHIAPIPVGLPVYLHGLKDERQTGGSQHHVHGHFLTVENLLHAGAHVGGGHEQLNAFAMSDMLEIHQIGDEIAQRIEVQGI